MLQRFRLDAAGVREVLKSTEVRTVVDDAAHRVAEHVRGTVPAGTTIEVRGYTTDREAATVVVADAEAMAWQARDGILTRAAAAVGLEVKQR